MSLEKFNRKERAEDRKALKLIDDSLDSILEAKNIENHM